MTRRTLGRLTALLLAFALIAAACSEDDGGQAATDEPAAAESATEPAEESPAEPTAAPADEPAEDTATAAGDESADEPAAEPAELSRELAWALDYIDGTPGAASGEPVIIGYGATEDFFPHLRPAAEAAVEVVNSQLGGINGRPLQIEWCNLNAPEAGASCAAEFANNDDVVAALSFSIFGNADYIGGLAGTKPLYNVGPLDIADFVSPPSTSFYTGALGAGMGLALFAASFGPQTVAVVVTDDAGGRGGYAVFEPVLQAAGIEVIPVFVPTTSTTPEIESALQAVGAQDVDVLVIGLFEPGCVSAVDALANLGLDARVEQPVVMSPSTCYAPGVREALAASGADFDIPNGWYFSHYGYNQFMGHADSGIDTTVSIINEALGDAAIGEAAAEQGVGGVMIISKILNSLDGDYSFDAVNGALKGFTGPAMNQAGPIECGQSPIFQAICASRVGIHRFLDGRWTAIAEGDNAVDISPVLNANPGG